MLAVSRPSEVIAAPAGARWIEQKATEWSEKAEGVSALTRREYAERARWAFDALRRLGYDVSPMQVTAPMVEALLHDESLAPTTRATYAFCLRGMLAHCGNPIASPERKRLWRPPRWVATRRRWATIEEMAALLNHARDARARAGISLLECGLRENEVVRASVLNLEKGSDGWTVTVRGKGARLRQVPLTVQAADALVPVVSGATPETRIYGFRRSRLWNDVRLAAIAAGIRHLSPHDVRRGFARAYLSVASKSGMSYPDALGSLQAILGHEDPAQTLYYAQPEQEVATRGVAAMSSAYAMAATGGAR